MARYLVIEFEDDDAAEKLRAMIDAQTKAGKRYRIAGIFARPKAWCRCPHPTGYHKDQIVRGRRFGWWVCIVCKRPRMGTHRPTNLMAATDLLPMPGQTNAIEELIDNISIFEVPTDNIKRPERTKELIS